MSTRSYRKRLLAPSATVLALSMAIGMSTLSWSPTVPAETEAESVTKASQITRQTLHKTVEIDGVKVFYREAGPADAPTILLLHGFPTSSHMFRNLIPALSDRFHLVAPDYPGFGNSDQPATEDFEYSFDMALFYDYQNNVLHYPAWQTYFRASGARTTTSSRLTGRIPTSGTS